MKPRRHAAPPPFRGLPPTVQTATFWLDDSGSRGSAHKGFVIAGLKTRHPDDLARSIFAVRESHRFHRGEFKFSNINDRNVPRFHDLVDVLADSEAHIVGAVLDAYKWNPFKGAEEWLAQTEIVSDVICSNLNRNEVAAAFIDGVSTPADVSMGRLVKRHANGLLGGNRVTTAVSLDSRTNDVMQAADLVAGAIRYYRFTATADRMRAPGAKDKIMLRLAAGFGVPDLSDEPGARVRLQTVCEAPRTSKYTKS